MKPHFILRCAHRVCQAAAVNTRGRGDTGRAMSGHDRITLKGSAAYAKNIAFDKNTGEIVDGKNLEPFLLRNLRYNTISFRDEQPVSTNFMISFYAIRVIYSIIWL
ncbi:MAG: hypothetical protein IJQ21_04040 [Lachnospiraceae bacterium]|nr:hypothetical protein [Lachnospiraceae bacterium]